MGHYLKKEKFFIACMINLIHHFSNIVRTARIASGCDVKAGGAESLQKQIMGYA